MSLCFLGFDVTVKGNSKCRLPRRTFPLVPGDTLTECCAFPPPPHWRLPSPPACGRVMSADVLPL